MSNASSQKAKKSTKPVAKEAEVPVAAVAAVVTAATPEAVVEAPANKSGTAAGAKEKKVPEKKDKLIRDSFTFPETDYARIAILKQRALKAGCEIKKSELLRAGLVTLSELSDEKLLAVLDGLAKLKPGRPGK